jgi:NAD+ kinase
VGETLIAGIVSRTDFIDALDVAKRVLNYLEKASVKVILETETAEGLSLKEKSNAHLSDIDADFLVTIGGDGTILRAAMEIKNPGTLLLGINMGRRGFLAEVQPQNYQNALNRVLKGDYYLEESLKLSSCSSNSNQVFPDALNEVLVASKYPSKMIIMEIKVNNETITEIQADGCIISTPTGSTAYNLSAGGSILSPDVEAVILTAICPYSYFKSIAIAKKAKVTVELLKPRTEAIVIVDGRTYIPLKQKEKIETWVSENSTNFIRFDSFYARLKNRLKYLQTQ